MGIYCRLVRSAFLVLCTFFLAEVIAAQQVPSTGSQANITEVYPDNGEGLRQLLDNMLLLAKKGDLAALQAMIQETEIPNYQVWFTNTFGKEKGESWAEPYGRWLTKNEKEFQELMVRLAHMDGEFVVEPAGAVMKSDLLNRPLDGYRADWKAARTPKGGKVVRLADFFFIEGKFRWESTVEYFPFQEPNKGLIVPAKLVHKVQPEYPIEARKEGIQGTVKLQVIIRKDGSVTVQDVLEGDPVLSPGAIEAVRQWRYEPWQLNGQTIEMQTTIDVTFSLKRSIGH